MMKRNLNVYRIHLSKIKTIRGGVDKDLKQKIVSGSKVYCHSLDEDLPVNSGWLPAETILEDFIDGKPFTTGHNSAKHWYVVELLCNGFGKELSGNTHGNWSVDDFFEYDEFRMYFLGMDDLVRLPSPETYPVVFTIEYNNLGKAKLKMDNSSHSDLEKNQFIDWVQAAMDHEQDLILFYY